MKESVRTSARYMGGWVGGLVVKAKGWRLDTSAYIIQRRVIMMLLFSGPTNLPGKDLGSTLRNSTAGHIVGAALYLVLGRVIATIYIIMLSSIEPTRLLFMGQSATMRNNSKTIV